MRPVPLNFDAATPYVETEALLAVAQDDRERLGRLLAGMDARERGALASYARSLAFACEYANVNDPGWP